MFEDQYPRRRNGYERDPFIVTDQDVRAIAIYVLAWVCAILLFAFLFWR